MDNILLKIIKFLHPSSVETIPVALGLLQQGSTMIKVLPEEHFAPLSFLNKVKALFFGIRLSEQTVKEIAIRHAKAEIFGGRKDLGHMLFAMNMVIQNKEWEKDVLSKDEVDKLIALQGLGMNALNKYSYLETRPPMNLYIQDIAPTVEYVLMPMTSCILLNSVRYYVDVNLFYSFGKIKASPHPKKNDLIAFLYEILVLQKKLAIELLEFRKLCSESFKIRKNKEGVSLVNEEVEAMIKADLIITYLKSTIEKIMALVGLIYGIDSLDSKKEHKKKVTVLTQVMSEKTKHTPYREFFLDYIKSENLEELNQLRTGMMHKRGSFKMQPHSYLGPEPFEDTPLYDLMGIFQKYHTFNSTALVSSFALLTDSIMALKYNEASIKELNENMLEIARMLEKYPPETFDN